MKQTSDSTTSQPQPKGNTMLDFFQSFRDVWKLFSPAEKLGFGALCVALAISLFGVFFTLYYAVLYH